MYELCIYVYEITVRGKSHLVSICNVVLNVHIEHNESYATVLRVVSQHFLLARDLYDCVAEVGERGKTVRSELLSILHIEKTCA